MSATESLRLLLDNTNGEIQGLEAENWTLREALPEQVAEAELPTEVQRLKQLYKQMLEDICKKDERQESRHLLEATMESLRSKEKTVAKLRYVGGHQRKLRQQQSWSVHPGPQDLFRWRVLQWGSESSNASRAMLANQVPPLLHFLGKRKMAVLLEIGMKS